MLLNSKEQLNFWRELERIEQWLSTHTGVASGRHFDYIGQSASQAFNNYGNHFAVGMARVSRVRQALDQSAPMAQRLTVQQLSGIELSTVWEMLIAACKEIALYYGGAVVTGAVIGGAIGSFAFGVGAAPGVVVGTTIGAQIGGWVLALLGLKALADGLGSMLPAALDHYERGFREAWGVAPGDRRDTWKSTAPASGNTYTAAWHMAQGHVIMVTAILTALVAYLTRGQTKKALLMHDIRNSPRLGPKFAEWLVENEGKLLSHPQLRALPSTSAGKALGSSSVPANGRGATLPENGFKGDLGGSNRADVVAQPGGSGGVKFPRTEGLGTHSSMADLKASGALPGEQGVIIIDRTVRFGDVYELGTLGGRKVEFSLVTEKVNGSLVKKLYSGDAWTSPVPRDARLLGHVHPNENAFQLWPSTQDMNMVNARYFRELMNNPNAVPAPTRIFWGPGNTDNTIFYPGFGKSPVAGKGG